jgi:hypothetical protein
MVAGEITESVDLLATPPFQRGGRGGKAKQIQRAETEVNSESAPAHPYASCCPKGGNPGSHTRQIRGVAAAPARVSDKNYSITKLSEVKLEIGKVYSFTRGCLLGWSAGMIKLSNCLRHASGKEFV